MRIGRVSTENFVFVLPLRSPFAIFATVIVGCMEKVLVITSVNELVRIRPDRVVYITSDGNYSVVTFHDRTEQVFSFNLLHMQRLIERQLQEEAARFIRIGKSLIINRDYIYKINPSKQQLVMADTALDGVFSLVASKEALRQLKGYLESIYGL